MIPRISKNNSYFFCFVLLFSSLFWGYGLKAQNKPLNGVTPCNDYTRLINEANQALKRQEYGLAIRKYNAAKVCNPSLGLKINQQILNIFERIDEQRQLALQNAQLAREAEREAHKQASFAKEQAIKAKVAQDIAEASAKVARDQKARADRLLSDIYMQEAKNAKENKAWDKALLNYYKAYEIDTTRDDALGLSIEAASMVIPEFLTIHRLNQIWDLQFSTDGRYLVSITNSNIHFYDLKNFRDVLTIRNRWPMDRIFFSPRKDSLFAVLSMYYDKVTFWNLVSHEEHPNFRQDLYGVNAIQFDPNANLFIYSTREGNLIFSRLDDKEPLSWIYPEKNASDSIVRIQFDYYSPDQLVAVANPKNKTSSIKIIDVSQIHKKKVKLVKSFGTEVGKVYFSPNGKQLGAIQEDSSALRIFDLPTGLETQIFQETQGKIEFFSFFNHGDNFLYAANNYRDSTSKIIIYVRKENHYEKQKEIWIANKWTRALHVHPDGDYIAAGLNNNSIKLWHLKMKSSILTWKDLDVFIKLGLSFAIDSIGYTGQKRLFRENTGYKKGYEDLNSKVNYSTPNDTLHSFNIYRAAMEKQLTWLPGGGEFLKLSYAQSLNKIINGQDRTPIINATMQPNKEFIINLLNQGASPIASNEQGFNAFGLAAFNAYNEEFDLMVKRLTRQEIEKEFLQVVANQYSPIVAYMLKRGVVDVNCQNIYGETALSLAAQFGDTLTMKILLKYGADPHLKDKQGHTPFLNALMTNHSAARLLLPFVKIIDRRDSLPDYTELMLAASNNYQDIAKVLIQKGANSNDQNKKQDTPMHYAAYNDNIEMIDLLLANGAKLDPVNRRGESPLYLAVQQGKEAMVEKLLNLGVEVNRKDTQGNTALMMATAQGHVNLVKLLLNKGANPNIHNIHQQTPIFQAKNNRDTTIYKLLIEAGAIDDKQILRDSIRLSGTSTNITANKSAPFNIVIIRQDTVYRAIGGFDNVRLFGNFDIEGREIHCTGKELCLQFTGLVLTGNEKDNFPKGTSTLFSIDLVISKKEATGTYHIGKILNSPSETEQYGILKLKIKDHKGSWQSK